MRNNRWGLILLALSLTLSLVGCSPKAPEETAIPQTITRRCCLTNCPKAGIGGATRTAALI